MVNFLTDPGGIPEANLPAFGYLESVPRSHDPT